MKKIISDVIFDSVAGCFKKNACIVIDDNKIKEVKTDVDFSAIDIRFCLGILMHMTIFLYLRIKRIIQV